MDPQPRPTIRFAKARPEDAKALALASWPAFDEDVRYGAPGKGGPPGYKSDLWQTRMMLRGQYFKILADEALIGGAIIFLKSPAHAELGRIFIAPDYQNRGIGAQAIAFLEAAFPHVTTWTLGTPAWNKRTQHFYEKMGYACVGQEGVEGLCYMKKIEAPRSLPSSENRIEAKKP